MIYLNVLFKKKNEKIDKSSILGKEIRKKLETDFKVELSPELKIQREEERTELEINGPIESQHFLKPNKQKKIIIKKKKIF